FFPVLFDLRLILDQTVNPQIPVDGCGVRPRRNRLRLQHRGRLANQNRDLVVRHLEEVASNSCPQVNVQPLCIDSLLLHRRQRRWQFREHERDRILQNLVLLDRHWLIEWNEQRLVQLRGPREFQSLRRFNTANLQKLSFKLIQVQTVADELGYNA